MRIAMDWVFVVGTLAFAFTRLPCAAALGPPNLIVALVDDLGYHNVGFKNPDQVSPAIDALAAEGVVLEAFYTFKFCSPSRSSLLSGRLPIHVNQQNPDCVGTRGGVDIRMQMLPEKLKSVGYSTALVGKWHLGARSSLNLPHNRGFDKHFGFLSGGEDHYTQAGYECPDRAPDLWRDVQPAFGEVGQYSCEMYSAAASNIVASHDPEQGPLFMYLAFHNTHAPYQVPDKYLDSRVDFAPRRMMQGMLTCVSEATGNLSIALRANRNMWNNTLMIWAADNGGPQYWNANNYPLRGGKGTDFEGGVRGVAFAAGGWLPASVRGGVVKGAIHISDLYVTFCLLAGGHDCWDSISATQNQIPQADGVDIRRLLTGTPETGVVVGNASSPRSEIPLSSNALIVGEWKFVANTSNLGNVSLGYWTGPVWPLDAGHQSGPGYMPDPGCPAHGCLFHLPTDPEERVNLAFDEPAKRDELATRLQDLRATEFQTVYTGGYDKCIVDTVSDDCSSPKCIRAVARLMQGFVSPPCAQASEKRANLAWSDVEHLSGQQWTNGTAGEIGLHRWREAEEAFDKATRNWDGASLPELVI